MTAVPGSPASSGGALSRARRVNVARFGIADPYVADRISSRQVCGTSEAAKGRISVMKPRSKDPKPMPFASTFLRRGRAKTRRAFRRCAKPEMRRTADPQRRGPVCASAARDDPPKQPLEIHSSQPVEGREGIRAREAPCDDPTARTCAAQGAARLPRCRVNGCALSAHHGCPVGEENPPTRPPPCATRSHP